MNDFDIKKGNGLGDVSHKILLGSGRPQGRAHHLVGGDLEIGNHTQCAMPVIVVLAPFFRLNVSRFGGMRRMVPSQRLNPRFLTRTQHMLSLRVPLQGLLIHVRRTGPLP